LINLIIRKESFLRLAMLLSADSCKEAVKVAAMVLKLCKDGRQPLKICAAFHVAFPDKIMRFLNLSERNGKGRDIKKPATTRLLLLIL